MAKRQAARALAKMNEEAERIEEEKAFDAYKLAVCERAAVGLKVAKKLFDLNADDDLALEIADFVDDAEDENEAAKGVLEAFESAKATFETEKPTAKQVLWLLERFDEFHAVAGEVKDEEEESE